MTTIDAPRSKAAPNPRRKGVNWEKWGWIYMRASGIVLLVLIFGHLFVNLFAGEGVKAIDFAFVAGKLADPFWVIWDTLLLWLALIHGANGMRTIVNDYANSPRLRRVLLGAILASTAVLLLLGTLVIYTFDPCPANAAADLLPSFCAGAK
jgi:succinate dehydrogenase / fumarate reductase membrane anchor subunit